LRHGVQLNYTVIRFTAPLITDSCEGSAQTVKRSSESLATIRL